MKKLSFQSNKANPYQKHVAHYTSKAESNDVYSI